MEKSIIVVLGLTKNETHLNNCNIDTWFLKFHLWTEALRGKGVF